MAKISAELQLAVAPAASLVLSASWETFALERNRTTTAASAGQMSLRLPTVCKGSAAPARIARPTGQPPKPGEFLEVVDYPPMQLTRLDNVICIPGGVAISEDGILLSESFSALWETQPHHHISARGEDRFSVLTDVDTENFLPGKFLFIDYQHLDHYGHFIFDVVSRFWAIEFANIIGLSEIKFLVRESTVAYIESFLEKFDVKPSQIQRINTPVICEELFVATKSIQIQEYTSPTADRTWSKIKDRTSLMQQSPSRIYVSRLKNKHRPLLNEVDVEKIFLSFGFSVLYPEYLSNDDQIRIFSQAQFIAGSSGTNMFNIAFQDFLSSALILTSPTLIQYSEQFLNGAIGSDLRYFIGEICERSTDGRGAGRAPEDPVHGAWLIPDLDVLKCEIDNWLKSNGG